MAHPNKPLPSLSAALLKQVEDLRRELHARPELAFAEHQSARRVASILQKAGLHVTSEVGGTGVVATLAGRRPGPTIALRAELDALPMQEQGTCAHRSKRDGVMHACGHDGHTAMLLGAALHLADHPDFAGSIHFIFQPAEEGGNSGADAMLADKLFERFPCQMIFGLHNWPGLPLGQLATRPGPLMAASASFEVTLTSPGTHAAMPHLSGDCVLACARLVCAAQDIVSRAVNPLIPAVVTIGRMEAGTARNVVASRGGFTGTARAFDEHVLAVIESKLRDNVTGIAKSCNVAAALNFTRQYPVLANHPQAYKAALKAMEALDAVTPAGAAPAHDADTPPTMAAEDFAVLGSHVPGCMIFLGAGENHLPLHHPCYDFPDALLSRGISFWTTLVSQTLKG